MGSVVHRRFVILATSVIGIVGWVRPVVAQRSSPSSPRVQPEARADFINARAAAAHLGVGVSVAAGTYVRFGLVAAAGQAWRDGESEAAGRVDALVRFVPDPFREFRWAPYAAGGVSAMYDTDERWRGVLVGVLGVEGPSLGSVVPAIEVGFGGGTRVGAVVRRALPGRR